MRSILKAGLESGENSFLAQVDIVESSEPSGQINVLNTMGTILY